MQWFMGLDAWLQALLASLIMYSMTALGAACVFFSRRPNANFLTLLLGASAGYLAGAALKPSPAQPDLFEAAGLLCLAGLTAFTVRLLWVRLSHRWSEHENPIGRR